MEALNSNAPGRLRAGLLALGQWAALLALFSVPINKPATNLFIALAVLGALFGERAGARLRAAARHPVAQGAVVWMGVLVLSALHTRWLGHGWPAVGSGVLALLYPWLIGSLLETDRWRSRGLWAFGLGVGLVLFIVWGQAAGVFPQREVGLENPLWRYTVFKHYTPQAMAFLMLASLAAAFALVQSDARRRAGLWFVVAAALGAVLLLMQSRTSYLVVLPLLLYWLWRLALRGRLGWRTAGVSLVLVATGAMVAWSIPNIQERLVAAVTNEINQYLTKREPTSTGIRLELWKQTLPIIAEAPWFGHGMGQWEPRYVAAIKDLPHFDEFHMGHPHQEALQILSEQGAVGLLICVALLVALARYIRRLDAPYRDFFACLLLIYVTASLANSLWVDFTHRHTLILLLACMPLARRPAAAGAPTKAAEEPRSA